MQCALDQWNHEEREQADDIIVIIAIYLHLHATQPNQLLPQINHRLLPADQASVPLDRLLLVGVKGEEVQRIVENAVYDERELATWCEALRRANQTNKQFEWVSSVVDVGGCNHFARSIARSLTSVFDVGVDCWLSWRGCFCCAERSEAYFYFKKHESSERAKKLAML